MKSKSSLVNCRYRKLFYSMSVSLILSGCCVLGSRPGEERVIQYSDSKNYDSEQEIFLNRDLEVFKNMSARNMNFKDILEFFKERVDAKPSKLLPESQLNVDEFMKISDKLKVIWFGHSSFLLNFDGTTILVDPVFSNSASPFSFLIKRFQPPVLDLEELPKIDFILISHDHYDHLDMKTVKFFKDKDTQFVTALGVGSHLEKWGITPDKITEKDWWEDVSFNNIRFIATPAQHFSGRGLFDSNSTQWASWVIQSDKHNVYFSGDSGYDTHFKEIGQKYGPFDVAFLESGQYNDKWLEVHMNPAEGVKAFKDLRAKKYFPVHWGMFVLAYHTWYDPMEQLFSLAEENEVELIVPKLGQIVSIEDDFINEFWWK